MDAEIQNGCAPAGALAAELTLFPFGSGVILVELQKTLK
jgi:hypothetical protein